MEQSQGQRAPDLAAAVRRIVVGFRVVAAGWLALLAGVGWGSGRVDAVAAATTTAVAVGWALVTVVASRGVRAGGRARTWGWIAADVGVGASTLLLPLVLSGAALPFSGGYPFSAVVVGAWLAGAPGALAAALVLAAATVARVPLGADAGAVDLVSTLVFYVLGAAVAAWGLEVLRRTSEQRDAAEAALGAERAERVVAEERAATAAHLHDSVLQTLALIQRRSDDPGEVVGLARSQERGLRDWLAQRDQPLASQESFGAALDTVAAEVERLHRVRVEVVHVGDRDLDVGLSAVVGAVREALVNAAKHAGVAEIRVYAEAGPRGASVFVRDRGSGFDPTGVAPDRRGIAGSVIGRVRSAGGRALVRSSPGGGTEVEITMPCHGDTDMG